MPEATSRSSAVILRGLALVLVAASLALALQSPPAMLRERPSILFLLVDTLRADYLGAYGFAGPVSPNIDRLAGESVLFASAFTQAPWTKPAIASLFTSLDPEQHGVLSHGGRYGDPEAPSLRSDGLSGQAVTLAEVLQGAGYETAAFVANPWLQKEHGFAQGFALFEQDSRKGHVAAEVLLRKARAWLAARKQDEPYFLYLHFMDVHGPYGAPEADFRALRGAPSVGERRSLTQSEAALLRPYLKRTGWIAGADALRLDTWRARYAAGVRAFDRQIGAFLDELRAAGALDDTLVILTSDHGEELLEHGDWDHGYALYEEQMRVPLLVRWPDGRGAGRSVNELVSLADLMPTLAGIAGAKPPEGLSGRDLGALFAGRPGSGRDAVFAAGVKWQPGVRAVRTRDRKLMVDERSGEVRLYDVKRDPHEKTDLAESEAEQRRALEQLLARHRADLASAGSLEAESVPVSPDLAAKLESLGYVGERPKASSRTRTRGDEEDQP